MTAKVSIILPFYNSAQFVAQAVKAILSQTFTDWQIIAVDDGSVDQGAEIFERVSSGLAQKIVFVQQENQGAYAARNTGLDLVDTPYLCFYDCDDLWYPGYLENGISVLENYPEVDWIFCDSKKLDVSGSEQKLICDSQFALKERDPKSFLTLETCELEPQLHLITNQQAAILQQFSKGLLAGLQFSVFRSTVFASYRFRDPEIRNEAADVIVVIDALKAGFRIAYTRKIFGEYHLHDTNSCAGRLDADLAHYIRIRENIIAGFIKLTEDTIFNAVERKALHRYLANQYFWGLGYNVFLREYRKRQNSAAQQRILRQQALSAMLSGLKFWPTNLKMIKTYLLTLSRIN